MATFYLCTSGGTASSERYNSGNNTTVKLFTTGSTIPIERGLIKQLPKKL